jgi:hypothetical protein
MTDDISERHAKEFFEAYGRALLRWQYVETNLFLIFSSLVRGRDHRVVAAAYHAVINLKSKLEMITEAMQAALPDGSPLLPEWGRIRTKIDRRARNRNMLAHYMVLGHVPKSATGSATLRLAPSIFDVRRRNGVEIDVKQLAVWNDSFGELSDKLDAFGKKLSHAMQGG